MLLTAGLINILFKKIKLPVILGYILAGFLISPYFPLFLHVQETDSISTWSDIGVIILLFCIGLEFDLHKLVRLGSSAVITAAVKLSGVIAVGFVLGIAMGLSRMSSILLGVMISISSTAIIQKCFEELNRTGQKYTKLVMGTLIVEDVVSVFVLIVLPAISVSRGVEGTALFSHLLLMVCYLIIWLLLGIFLLPTFLNWVIGIMNDEMVAVLSLGICLGMAVLANKLGFSVELGAFIAGSLLAGTVHVERIEQVTKNIKDVFGAIFFISVGMKVDPQVIADKWTVILPIAAAAVLAKLVFATAGMLLSGQSMSNSVKSGFSLAPIGEFSFIIASMGISLGVLDPYLYPVIVSASIITVLFAPYLINNAERFAHFADTHLPQKFIDRVEKYTSSQQVEEDSDNEWAEHMRLFFSRLVIYGVIMLVAAVAGERLLFPALSPVLGSMAAEITACAATYAVMALFLRPLMNFHSPTFTSLWLKSKSNHLPLIMLIIFKVIVVTIIAVGPIRYFFGISKWLLVVAVMVLIVHLARTDFMAASYLKLETMFLSNLNEKTLRNEKLSGGRKRLDEVLSIISFIAPEDADYLGKPVSQLQWSNRYNIYIVKIRHRGKHTILPEGGAVIHPGDKVFALGERRAIDTFYNLIKMRPEREIRTLRQFMESGYPDVNNAIACCAVKVSGKEPFVNQAIKASSFRTHWHCMIIGIQKSGMTISMPDPNIVIKSGDVLWIMGSNNNVGRFIGECVLSGGEGEER